MDQSTSSDAKFNRFLTLLPRGAIRLYQFLTFAAPKRCRFYPSCSQYFYDALMQEGLLRGTWAGTKRILKCHPWNAGGHDPIRHPL